MAQAFYAFGTSLITLVITQEVNQEFLDVA